MTGNKKNILKGEIILLMVAVLWGSCFIFQKKGMDYIGPYTLGTFRFTLGGLVLLPIIKLFSKSGTEKPDFQKVISNRKSLWQGGVLCGVALFFAATLQQVGLVYTTAGKAAFLTSMQIVVVAIAGIIIVKKASRNTIIGMILALSGMYLLSIQSGVSINFGDILELSGSLFWGAQILFIDKFAKQVDNMKLSFIQFIVAGGLSAVGMFIFEKPNIKDIYLCAVPILYTAIIEVAICYTLQIIAQKYVPPVIAAVILSLESVFAAIFGMIFLKEILTSKELTGMVLMLIAVVIIQIPAKENDKKNN